MSLRSVTPTSRAGTRVRETDCAWRFGVLTGQTSVNPHTQRLQHLVRFDDGATKWCTWLYLVEDESAEGES